MLPNRLGWNAQKRLAEDPERAERLKARDEIVAARNRRVAEREAERQAAQEREAAELAARDAAEAAAREAEQKARDGSRGETAGRTGQKGSRGSRRTGGAPRCSPRGQEKKKAQEVAAGSSAPFAAA